MKSYRKNGPARHTKALLEFIRALGLQHASLLDVGGGVGIIYHELLNDVIDQATHVDASSAYLEAARTETEKRGNTERVQFVHADFVDVANDLPKADVVTLDRVVCCYPNFRELLKAAANKSRKAIALTYPRDAWHIKAVIGLMNLYQRVIKDPFRVFVHPVAEMESLLNGEGLRKVSIQRTPLWEMALYQRV